MSKFKLNNNYCLYVSYLKIFNLYLNSQKTDIMSFNRYTITKIFIIIIVSGLTLLSFSNYFHNDAFSTINSANSKIAKSSKFVFELKKGISFFNSSKIPVIQGYAQVSLTDLNKISNYLTASRILLKLQLLILKITNIKLIKILPLLLCIGLFFKYLKLTALKLICLSLFLTPGLSVFTYVIHNVTETINNQKIGVELYQKLESTKNTFDAKQLELKKDEKLIQKKQLEKAKEKGKQKISVFKRIEDKVVTGLKETVLKIEEDTQLIKEVLLINTEKLFLHLIQLISTLLLLVVILPLLYFYGIKKIIQNLFQFNIVQILEKLLLEKPNNE